ncbi:MAG: peptidoglycan-binding protein [Treponema sp.]|jgi:hypothetical protein|nr:peptidoglycan-binding protein [Treponema sp.]
MNEYKGFTGKNVISHVTDEIFDADSGEDLSFLDQARVFLHLLFCSRCSEEVKKIETLREIMSSDFFPPESGIAETIMDKIAAAEDASEDISGRVSRNNSGISTMSWIIIGCFMLLSMITVFFTLDFTKIADAEGYSFLLPVGLTIGLILTGYIALFAGSHLKDFSNRFHLQ